MAYDKSCKKLEDTPRQYTQRERSPHPSGVVQVRARGWGALLARLYGPDDGELHEAGAAEDAQARKGMVGR